MIHTVNPHTVVFRLWSQHDMRNSEYVVTA